MRRMKDKIEATVTNADYATSAGSATNATKAITADKLGTSAGTTTQPVYFKDGKPVVIGYTVAKSVPADAKFTDTNTWRGIQNNLTSDRTDQSLSAAQGKILKSLIDSKANSANTYTKTQTDQKINSAINAHNSADSAHSDIRTSIADMSAAINVLELKINTNVTNNPFKITFNNLDGLNVTGVWNIDQERLEF